MKFNRRTLFGFLAALPFVPKAAATRPWPAWEPYDSPVEDDLRPMYGTQAEPPQMQIDHVRVVRFE